MRRLGFVVVTTLLLMPSSVGAVERPWPAEPPPGAIGASIDRGRVDVIEPPRTRSHAPPLDRSGDPESFRDSLGARIDAAAERMADSVGASSHGWGEGSLSSAGDLDGDGAEDVLLTRDDGRVTVFELLSGRDGSSMWSVERPDFRGHAYAAPVGPDGVDGILIVSYDVTYLTRTVVTTTQVTMRLTALDGHGGLLWDRTLDGLDERGLDRTPVAWGLMDATPSSARDLLVVLESGLSPVEPHLALVLDGADGSEVSRGSSTLPDPRPMVVPDLSGDGADDYLLTWTGSFQGRIEAFASDDGRLVWRNDEVPLSWYDDDLLPVGDVTGDAIGDLFASNRYGCCYGDHDGLLLSGTDGQPTWSGIDPSAHLIGDVDGDGDGELGTASWNAWDDEEMSVTYSILGDDGASIRSTTYRLPTDRSDSTTRRLHLHPDLGDVDGDGVRDAGHQMGEVNWDTEEVRNEAGAVSGDDHAKLWDGSIRSPLFASLDGDGDDLLTLRGTADELRFEAQDGATGTVLWAATVPVSYDLREGGRATGDLTGDGAAELVFLRSGYTYDDDLGYRWVSRIFAVDGRDGSMVWDRSWEHQI